MRSLRIMSGTIVVALLCGTTPRRAHAEPSTAPSPAPISTSSDAPPSPADAPTLVDPAMHQPWHEGSARSFVGTTVDAGFLYLRPRVQLGYGRPHATWVGIEANPIGNAAGLGAYGGLRVAIPHADLRAGSRYFTAFNREYLLAARSYDRIALDSTEGTKAHTLTHEVELNANVPAGPGEVLLLGSFSIVTGVPQGYLVFEETLRLIVDPPYVWRGRAGYSLSFGEHQQASIAWVVDVLGVPDRSTTVVRTGPLLRFMLSRSFELRGSFVAAVHSPDHLGLLDGDFTEFGVRWRWASGE